VGYSRSADGRPQKVSGYEKCTKASIVLGASAPLPYRAHGTEYSYRPDHQGGLGAESGTRGAPRGGAACKNAYPLPMFETLVCRTIMKAMGFPLDR
jgi:hypothetical protein